MHTVELVDQSITSTAMGMTQSQSSKCVLWAAQDGRLNDLIYHLQDAGPEALAASSLSEKRQAPIHLAAIRGHTKCIQVLREAGKSGTGMLQNLELHELAWT